MGLSDSLFGWRLLPIGTVYDPFISRGLDALNYACYQDARFIIVGTPSGVSLAPEGGAHQSIYTPLIGMGQPGLTSYEPAFVDELSEILRWSFLHLQAPDGGAVYLRLTTRPVTQPARPMTSVLIEQVIEGAYWLEPPDSRTDVVIVACGAVVPEAMEARLQLIDDMPGVGILVVTSPGRLEHGWRAAETHGTTCHIARLLEEVPDAAGLVTVIDGHPATLSWLGAVRRHRVMPLGVDRFGQSGDVPDLYHVHGIDADAIVGAAARLIAPKRR